jgi:hypothetical protein
MAGIVCFLVQELHSIVALFNLPLRVRVSQAREQSNSSHGREFAKGDQFG